MLTLYFCPTPNCQKVTIMLKAINAEFETRKIDILAGDQNQPEFVSICPNKKVPVLIDEDYTGGIAVRVYQCEGCEEEIHVLND